MYPFLKDKRALREQFRALRAESKSEARDTEIARRFFSSAFFVVFEVFSSTFPSIPKPIREELFGKSKLRVKRFACRL